MSESNPETFFESWLPERYATLTRNANLSKLANCSLYAEVGESAWTVAVEEGRLKVTRGASEGPWTFRVRTTNDAFERLLSNSLASLEGSPSALKLFELDEETCRLIAEVPGALCVRVRDEHADYEVVLGPGNSDLDSPGCNVTCSLSDLQRVQRGETSPVDLFMGGNLTLDGNLEIAMALGGLLL